MWSPVSSVYAPYATRGCYLKVLSSSCFYTISDYIENADGFRSLIAIIDYFSEDNEARSLPLIQNGLLSPDPVNEIPVQTLRGQYVDLNSEPFLQIKL